jgi:hypothetical protein
MKTAMNSVPGTARRILARRVFPWLVSCAASFGVALAAPAFTAAAGEEPAAELWERAGAAAQVRVEGERLYFTGEIMESTNPQVYEQYAQAQPKPRIFAVASRGGSVRAAIELALWILEREMQVEVLDYCLSSCANYILAAGATTRISEHAALAWHGGALQPIPYEAVIITDLNMNPLPPERAARIRERDRAEREQYVAQLKATETAFFQRVGVSQQMTVLGQQERYHATRAAGETVWDFSLEDLRSLGLRRLEVIGAVPWNPPRVLPSGRKLFRISLRDHPELELPPAPQLPADAPGD